MASSKKVLISFPSSEKKMTKDSEKSKFQTKVSGKSIIQAKVEEASSEENRSARRLVFEKIVAATIEDPNHPYYSLIPQQLRQEMIDEITDQLVDSHYLND